MRWSTRPTVTMSLMLLPESRSPEGTSIMFTVLSTLPSETRTVATPSQ